MINFKNITKHFKKINIILILKKNLLNNGLKVIMHNFVNLLKS